MSEDDQNKLSDHHHSMLIDGSAITEDAIHARGYRTITDPRELGTLGFTTAQQITPGLWIPGVAPDGSNGFGSYRPDFPRQKRNSSGGLTDGCIKYETPKGAGVRVDTSPLCLPLMGDPGTPLWITEGAKKCDALASHGLCAISLNGVYGFKGKNVFGGVTFLADFDHIHLKGREVRIVFDSDVMVNPMVRAALSRLTEHLQRKGAHVACVYLPGGRDTKVGVDDFLLTHKVEELEALIDAPRPQAEAAKPGLELLDNAPLVQRRPLALIDGRAYVAIWPHVRITVTETLNKEGNITKHDPPIVRDEQRLMIVRDDGVVFGDTNRSLEELGFAVTLSEIPPADRLWSTPGVKRFVAGERPPAADVFRHICEVVDRFIDFDKSTASQQEMCEFVACYVLATWFLDAFNVAGFLWPNGERGSGKTQLLTIIAALGYLGQVILAGGSFASLRDMADYGAMLCFDDAENLSDPKQTDPDKRTLLLAGNRRGNSVPVKEPAPDRTWRTRYVSTFCPRAFSAIRLPDAVLASRTIIVPLIRTPDRARANADPLSFNLWPHEPHRLVDDLWALSLANLAQLPVYDGRVGEQARLSGRNLEPWRAVLAVALWLEDNGVAGLWQRMDALSEKYQSERQEFESSDLTVLVVRALCKCLGSDVSDVSDVLPGDTRTFVTTSEITEAVKEIAADSEADVDIEKISTRRIGWVLKKLRLKAEKSERNSSGTKRGWPITGTELLQLVRRYGLSSEGTTYEKNVRNVKTSEVIEESEEERDELAAILDGYAGIDPASTDMPDVTRHLDGEGNEHHF